MGKRILVIDDDVGIVLILRDRLRSYGYEVTCAYDGATGIEKISEVDPHCVLLDLEMPGMSGFEVLEALKKSRPALPVLVVTASASKPAAKRALDAGAAGYVLKPFDPETLRKEVGRITCSAEESK